MRNSLVIDINRERARLAYVRLQEYLELMNTTKDNKENKVLDSNKMKSYCRKLPVMIKTSGLISTLSFIRGKSKLKGKEGEAKDKNEYDFLYPWLIERLSHIDILDEPDIVLSLLKADIKTNRLCTKEILEYAIWLKKQAEAMIEGET